MLSRELSNDVPCFSSRSKQVSFAEPDLQALNSNWLHVFLIIELKGNAFAF